MKKSNNLCEYRPCLEFPHLSPSRYPGSIHQAIKSIFDLVLVLTYNVVLNVSDQKRQNNMDGCLGKSEKGFKEINILLNYLDDEQKVSAVTSRPYGTMKESRMSNTFLCQTFSSLFIQFTICGYGLRSHLVETNDFI